MLRYPLEVFDGARLLNRGRSSLIGRMNVLCPAYRPKFPLYRKHFSKLSDTVTHIPALIKRKDNAIYLTTEDGSTAINMFLFGKSSDAQVIKYLEKYEGWTRDLHPLIATGKQFQNVRVDHADNLYKWETQLPMHVISRARARKILFEELAQLPFDYSTDFVDVIADDDDYHGTCSVKKRAGWFARPYHIQFLFKNYKQTNVLLYVTLHEIAHALDFYVYRVSNHGPTFMHVYAKLLDKYMGIDPLGSMYAHGLIKRK